MFKILLLSPAVLWAWGCGDSSPTNSSPPPTGSATTTTTAPPASTTTSALTTTTTTSGPSRVLRRATFQSANGYTTQGSAQIVMTGSQFTLELGSDFRSSPSPALDLRLCNDINCRDANLDLGPLRSFSGSQTYSLPNDGARYDRVVIFCRAVQLAFGFGLLR